MTASPAAGPAARRPARAGAPPGPPASARGAAGAADARASRRPGGNPRPAAPGQRPGQPRRSPSPQRPTRPEARRPATGPRQRPLPLASGSACPASQGRRPAAGPQTLARPSAVLDEAHLGDIEGALGRIRVGDDTQRSGLRRRLITFLAIVGPGLIVMVGDNDAGGVSTYAQAGQDYGYSLLWMLLLLIPVLIVNQEMVVRLGAVTGVGHARLINERFGRFWGWFSVGDLFVLNFLTIVTEFIGVSLALAYFGVSPYIAVPGRGRWCWSASPRAAASAAGSGPCSCSSP